MKNIAVSETEAFVNFIENADEFMVINRPLEYVLHDVNTTRTLKIGDTIVNTDRTIISGEVKVLNEAKSKVNFIEELKKENELKVLLINNDDKSETILEDREFDEDIMYIKESCTKANIHRLYDLINALSMLASIVKYNKRNDREGIIIKFNHDQFCPVDEFKVDMYCDGCTTEKISVSEEVAKQLLSDINSVIIEVIYKDGTILDKRILDRFMESPLESMEDIFINKDI